MTSVHVRRLQWLKANTKRRFIELAAANPGLPFHELVEMQLPWFTLRDQDGQPAEPGKRYESVDVLVYDEIGGSFGVDAGTFAELVGGLDTPLLRVRINSPGGSVFDAKAIHSTLLHHPARVQTYVDGLAASAASIVLLAGDEIVVMPGGEIMVHDASMMERGNPADHTAAAAFLERECQSLAEMYAARTGGDVEQWRDLMRAETWMYGREAIELGIADRLEGYPNRRAEELARSFDLSQYRYAGRAAAPAPGRRSTSSQPLQQRSAPTPASWTKEGDAEAFDRVMAKFGEELDKRALTAGTAGDHGDETAGGRVYTNDRTAALVGEIMMGRQSDTSGYVIAQARGDGMM